MKHDEDGCVILARSVPTGAVLRCPDDDVRTAEVFAALDNLRGVMGDAMALDQFKAALDIPDRWERF